jgi:hypothetical protein
MKKKPVEKYIIMDETDQSIVSWCDSFDDAKMDAIGFADKNSGHDIIFIRVSEAYRVIFPQEPQLEIHPMKLEEL